MKSRFIKVAIVVIPLSILVLVLPTSFFDLLIYSVLLLLLLLGFIENAIEYIKTRKGPFATGEITSSRKIEDGEDYNDRSFEVEFISPYDDNKYKITFKSVLLYKYIAGAPVKVWVNKRNPSKSVVLDKFNNYWILHMVSLLVFIIGISIMLILNIRVI